MKFILDGDAVTIKRLNVYSITVSVRDVHPRLILPICGTPILEY